MADVASNNTTLISYTSLGRPIFTVESEKYGTQETLNTILYGSRGEILAAKKETQSTLFENKDVVREGLENGSREKDLSASIVSSVSGGDSTKCEQESLEESLNTSSTYSDLSFRKHRLRFWLNKKNICKVFAAPEFDIEPSSKYQAETTIHGGSKYSSDGYCDIFPAIGCDQIQPQSFLQVTAQSRTLPFSEPEIKPDIIIYQRARRHHFRIWLNKYLPEDKYKGNITEVRISQITAHILEIRQRAAQVALDAAEEARIRCRRRALIYASGIAAACFARVRIAEKAAGASHGSLATELMNASEQLARAGLVSRFYNKDYQKLRSKFNEHFKYKSCDDYYRPIVPIRVQDLDKNSAAYQMYVRMKRIPRPPALDGTVLKFHHDRLIKRDREFEIRYERYVQELSLIHI